MLFAFGLNRKFGFNFSFNLFFGTTYLKVDYK